ncbi:olfactomedin-4 [Nerophis lumbriciformis]|uniref:olfactomedin-4 n=1 Tax=Nerophis lumbriciformis TaxID=546530 RepID=UPI002AE09B9C|nr:olfactomedin-4-like [Nerophis lumbriciformis]
MIGTLYFFALLSSTPALGGLSQWSELSAEIMAGSGGADFCSCDAFLPSSTFPLKDLVMVEQTAEQIYHKLEMEMGKMEDYEIKMTQYAERIIELTTDIEILEKKTDTNNDATLEDLEVKIKQVEALIKELQLSFKSSTTVFESLHQEITLIVETLDQMEKTHDRNLVLLTRREYIKIQMELEECERRHQELFNPNIGSCAHTGIIKVSKPIVSQLNAHLSSGYIYGGWGKDSKPIRDRESMYWFSGDSGAYINNIRFYTNYKNLVLRTPFLHHTMPNQWRGIGSNYIVRDNTLYYQNYIPFGLAKYNFTSATYESRVIPGASKTFSYAKLSYQIFDFAADETGLWVAYTTDESNGKMVVAKINEESFGIVEQWQTSLYKPSINNVFMVCGVLYAVRTVDIQNEEIFFMFDTKTRQEKQISILFERFQDKYSNLDYNPTDQKLYMYNDGYYVKYHLWFNHTTEATAKPLMVQNPI